MTSLTGDEPLFKVDIIDLVIFLKEKLPLCPSIKQFTKRIGKNISYMIEIYFSENEKINYLLSPSWQKCNAPVNTILHDIETRIKNYYTIRGIRK